jgi:branched-chain amino acid transport system substrate-binding protein
MPSTDLIQQAVERIKELLATSNARPSSAVMLYVNDTFGQTASKAVAALWEKLGIPIKIRDQISYDIRARDLSVEVAKAKALNPDLVLTVNRVNDGILIVQEMVKQNFSPMAIISPGSPGSYEKPFTDTLGKYSNDYLNAVPWYDVKNPRTGRVLAAFEKAYPGQRFELNTAFSFDALEIVANALSRASAPTPAAIHAALRTTNIEDHITTGGPIRFDAKGQNTNIRSALLQNRDQQPVVVGPKELAVAPPRFPMVPFEKR